MEETIKVIVFTLNGQRFGTNVQQVISIEKMKEITKVPGTSSFIKGIFSFHGETVPVLELKERLQMELTAQTESNRIIVVKIDDIQVGLIVDAATDVLDIDAKLIEDSKTMGGVIHKDYINGVAKLENELLILLNLGQVLALEEKEELQEVLAN
jgi:purine-binding chemotaxis protein CheW